MQLSYLHFEGFLIAQFNLYPKNKLDLAAYIKQCNKEAKMFENRKDEKRKLGWFFKFDFALVLEILAGEKTSWIWCENSHIEDLKKGKELERERTFGEVKFDLEWKSQNERQIGL